MKLKNKLSINTEIYDFFSLLLDRWFKNKAVFLISKNNKTDLI